MRIQKNEDFVIGITQICLGINDKFNNKIMYLLNIKALAKVPL